MTHRDDLRTRRANLAFIRHSMRAALLTRDREIDLSRRWRERKDEAALHELILSHMRLVIAIASRFRNYGLPLGDLIQEGSVGLMQAALRFDCRRNVRFSTYAVWWVRAAMQDYILRNWSVVRAGTTAAQKSLFFNLRRMRDHIERATGEALTPQGRASIAKTLEVSLPEVEAMEARLAGADRSLNASIGSEGEEEWQNSLPDMRPGPEEVVIGMRDAATRSRWLNEALGELTRRERAIIEERRLSEEAATLEELGREFGVSKERVRQLENRALRKLRNAMLRRAGEFERMPD